MLDLPVLLLTLPQARMDIIRQQLLLHFDIEKEDWVSTPVRGLFYRWDKYLRLPAEKHGEYDHIKKMVIQHLGENVFAWVRDFTTFTTRDVILKKRHWPSDRVVVNMNDLINYPV